LGHARIVVDHRRQSLGRRQTSSIVVIRQSSVVVIYFATCVVS
jgi:hypothetical protein